MEKNLESKSCSPQLLERLTSMKDLTPREVFKLFHTDLVFPRVINEKFSAWLWAKNVKIGKMTINDVYVPAFKKQGLLPLEKSCVFYYKTGLLGKLFGQEPCIVFWKPFLKDFYIVPDDAVVFERVLKDTCQQYTLFEDTEKIRITDSSYNRKEHTLYQYSKSMLRQFRICEKNIMHCTQDIAKYCLGWTDPDGWVPSRYNKEISHDAMYFLRNDYPDAPATYYPERPVLYGYEIDE